MAQTSAGGVNGRNSLHREVIARNRKLKTMRTQLDDLKDELKEVNKQIDLMVAYTPRSIALRGLRDERDRIISYINNMR